MDIMALIDRIEELIDSGRNVPFSSNKVVDPEKVYEIIDEIRAQFPDELKQARWIVKERQEMLEEAEKEANRVLEEAATARSQSPPSRRSSARRAAARRHPRRRARAGARDPARRRGLRRRDARQPRGQPRQAADRRAARSRPPAGQGRRASASSAEGPGDSHGRLPGQCDIHTERPRSHHRSIR